MKTYTTYLLTALCTLLISGSLHSQPSETYLVGIRGSLITAGKQLSIADPMPNTGVKPMPVIRVVLRWAEDRNLINTNRIIKVPYKITLKAADGSAVSVSDVVTVNYDAEQAYTDIHVRQYEKYVSADLVVEASGLSASIPDDVILELQTCFDRYTTPVSLSAPQNIKGSIVPDKNRLLITWDFLPGAESYDLDFLFIDNPKLAGNIPYDFSNATRVNVPGNYYEVSLSYPKGSILYRVRGVGKILLAESGDHPVYGAWNFTSDKGNTLPAVNSSIRFDYGGLEKDLNWQYTAVYAEDGKRKEVVTFFDGTLRNRQQVTVGNTQETAVVAETFYDHIGRPALQSIPAPTPGAGIRYYGQNGTSDGNFNGYFSKSVYDTDYGVTHTLPFSTETGSGKYYSPGNPFLSIPNQVNVAQVPETYGFTYSRQRFLNDGTDRVHSSGAPGEQFGLGSGHETKFYYGTPLQPELDRLFGNEVGEARHYQKKITVDPNGTATVEYLDMKERVIATSLAGGGDNLVDVDMTPGPQSLSEHTIFDSTQTTVTRDIVVTAPSTHYTFHYRFDPAKPLCDTCEEKTGCADCYYRVTFLLRDNESMEYVFREERVTNSVVNLSYTKTLDIGSYQLLKKVEVYEAPVEYFWEEFAQRQQHCVDFVPVEPEPCLSECEKYCKDLCADDDCYKQCLYDCENPPVDTRSECRVKYDILKNDMSPDGQYYDNRHNLCPLDTNLTPYDPDARNNFLLGIKRSCLDADPDLKKLMQDIYHISPPNYGALFDSMRVNWQSSYGDIMVKYHPEYDLYLYFCQCNEYGSAFEYYDSLLFNIQDYKKAAEMGLMNPLDLKYDPYTRFTPEKERCYQPYPETGFTDPRFSEKTSCCKESKDQISFIRGLLEQYLSWEEKGKYVHASVWYVLDDPDKVAQGSGAITDPQVVEYITQIQTVVLPQYAEIYGSFDNAKWVFFRSLYLGMRQTTMAQFMKECMNRKYYYCREEPLATGQQDWFAGQFPYEILKELSEYYLAVDTSLCRNVPLTHEGFQVRYIFNPVYSLTGNNMDYMAAQAQQDVMDNCLSECEANANSWLRQLEDYISVACPFWQDSSNIHYLRDRLIDLCMEGCHKDPTSDQLIDLNAYYEEMNKYCSLKEYPNYPLIVYPDRANLLECGCETFQLQLNAHDLTFWSPKQEIMQALKQDEIEESEKYADVWVKFCTKDLYQMLLKHDYDTTVWNTIHFPEEFRCADPTDIDWLKQCELLSKMNAAAQNAQLRAAATEEAVQAQKQKYAQHCIQNIYDEMTISCQNGEFLFTLYYYDQADNLIKTVPPKGVKVITDAVTLAKVQQYRLNPEGYEHIKPGFVHPAHTMITNYRYNTLNQLIYSRQPDHDGEIITFYDALARPVISQNAKQKAAGKYSYTIYDDIGRIIEVGELHNYFPMTTAIAYNAVALSAYISSSTRGEVTKTFYDKPLKTIPGFDQQYLRNRIAAVTYSDLYNANPLIYTTATHYSYDVHGNIQTLVQNISRLANYDREYIFIDYRYDLVSGNVNKVLYQPGKPEQFIHRYRYDADNRITHAITSKDGIIWETEARYFYYPHGALARTELGQKQVQGTDYAYTLQGWTKAVNSFRLNENIDIGKDGSSSLPIVNPNRYFAFDAISYSMQYFKQDYTPIAGNAITLDHQQALDLFNGNISAMSTGIGKKDGSAATPMIKVFKYDKLNRIKEMKTAYYPSTNWQELSQRFSTNYTYDFNGNLLFLQRRDSKEIIMHEIKYNYSSTQNRLNSIAGTGINSSSYKYDRVGNLTEDMGEHLNIAWNSSGKVTSVSGGSSPVNFAYSPTGQRQVKGGIVDGMKAYDFYIHDATGNTMAIYNLVEQTGLFMLSEEHIYGSGRLGIYNRNITLTPVNEISFTRGIKYYELTDHLGNVSNVISDRKARRKVYEYVADNKKWIDYYPFGYQIKERTWQNNDPDNAYRFGFNGQEKDDEIYGIGNSTTAEFWQYDTRLGRRWNVDPVMKPWESSYATFSNNPLLFIDPLGLDTIKINENGYQLERTRAPGEHVLYAPPLDPITVDANPSNEERNPYSVGTVFYKAFENNRNNPNLWKNKKQFDWAGISRSPWMRDFDRAFGTPLNITLGAVGGAGVFGAASASGSIGLSTISGTTVTGFLKTAMVKFLLDAGIQFGVYGFDINKVDWFDAGLSSVLPFNKKYMWLLESGANAFVDYKIGTGFELNTNPNMFFQTFSSNLFFKGAFKANYKINLGPVISNQFRYGNIFNQGFNSAVDAANSATNGYLIEQK